MLGNPTLFPTDKNGYQKLFVRKFRSVEEEKLCRSGKVKV